MDRPIRGCIYASLLVFIRREQTSPWPSGYCASVHTAEQCWSVTALSLGAKLSQEMHMSSAPHMLAPDTLTQLVGSHPVGTCIVWMPVPSTCGPTSTAPQSSVMETQPMIQLLKKEHSLGKQLAIWLFLTTYAEKKMLKLCELG